MVFWINKGRRIHMAGISFYNSNSISTLLSFGNNNNKNTGIFGNGNFNGFSGVDFSTLSSIRNGSYSKLLKAYYAQSVDEDSSSKKSAAITDKKDKPNDIASQKLNGAEVRDESSDVVDSISALRKEALWEKKSVTDEQGITTEDYDKEAIYKAVSKFVSDYNELIDSTGKSEDKGVLRTASSMVTYTKVNKKMLNNIGITVGSDNKLSVDKKKFKESSMTDVKSAFAGSSCYGNTILKNASSINASAKAQVARLDSVAMYSKTGRYSYMTAATYNQYL